MKEWLINQLHRFLARNTVFPPLPNLSEEQALGFMCELWTNPAFQRFLNAREEYLIHQGMELLLAKDPPNADMAAGQIAEIRNMRERTRSAYLIIEKRKKDKATKEKTQK